MDRFRHLPIYYDAEFTGLHRNTTLISIGMCTEYGAHFYGEFTDYDRSQLNPWLEEHVIKNLLLKDAANDYLSTRECDFRGVNNEPFHEYLCKGNTRVVRGFLMQWLQEQIDICVGAEKIQFFTDCYAYDWMLLNDLLAEDGDALKIPDFIYYIPMDLSTVLQEQGHDPDISREEFAASSLEHIAKKHVFSSASGPIKHSSLWDAYVARECFKLL